MNIMAKYCEMLNFEISEYFNILCNGNYPDFIDKYIETDELQRLSGIGQFCGCDYTKIHNIKYWFSRLDHSIATALMAWHFSQDKKQTLAALFHDLGTPAFSHCVDYMLGDFIKQESSERKIYDIISNSTSINKYLIEDGIDVEDIQDISKYTIVENEKPKICVDRLDGILGTCLIWRQFWDINTVREVYQNMIVLTDEESKQEIGFKNIDICEKFFEGVFEYSMALQQNEDKFAMQFIADALKQIINNKQLTLKELYDLSEADVIEIIKKANKNWDAFAKANKVARTNKKPVDNYFVSIDSKKRYVIPLLQHNNKTARLNTVSEECKARLCEYLNYSDSQYAYVKTIKYN
jgi:hypothetical protein